MDLSDRRTVLGCYYVQVYISAEFSVVLVLDLVSQVRNVVLMNVYLGLGNPGGSGFWNGGYMSQGREVGSQFTSNLDTRWTDPVAARRVPSK